MTSFSTRFAAEKSRQQYTPERLLLPDEYRAPEHNLAAELMEHNAVTVRASGLGGLPGTQIVDAVHRVRGELGYPHLPFFPELPERGWQCTTLARTVATLSGLELEGASYGWRLVHARNGSARESSLARACYASDINALADVVGGESSHPSAGVQSLNPVFKIQLYGLYTFAARVYLPNGERAISDAGAVRDLRDAFLEGLGETLVLLRQALDLPDARVAVQLDEPELGRVIAGTIPTVSGFRTIPAVSVAEIYEGYRACTEACETLRVTPVLNLNGVPLTYPGMRSSFAASAVDVCAMARVLSTPDTPAELLFDPDQTQRSTVEVPSLSDPHRWEITAAVLDSGARIWLPVIDLHAAPEQAQKLWRLWRELGLQKAEISSCGLMNRAHIERITPHEATLQMTRTAECARIVAEIASEGLG